MIETDGEKLNFKQYIPTSKCGILYVAISKENIYLPVCCHKYLQRKRFCELFYDEKQKIIAIRPTHVEALKTMKIRNHTKGSKSISIIGFFREFKISPFLGTYKPGFKSKRFIVRWSDKNKCFLIDLKNGG